jgi:hypothetical protein
MDKLIDDVARTLGKPMHRRRALAAVAALIVGALFPVRAEAVQRGCGENASCNGNDTCGPNATCVGNGNASRCQCNAGYCCCNPGAGGTCTASTNNSPVGTNCTQAGQCL